MTQPIPHNPHAPNPLIGMSIGSAISGTIYCYLGQSSSSNIANFTFGALMPLVAMGARYTTEEVAQKIFKTINRGEDLTYNQIAVKEYIKLIAGFGTEALTALVCQTLGLEVKPPVDYLSQGVGASILGFLKYAPAAIPTAAAVAISASAYDENLPFEEAIKKPVAVISSLFMTAPVISGLMHYLWDNSYTPTLDMLSWEVSTAVMGVGSAYLLYNLISGPLQSANSELMQRKIYSVNLNPTNQTDQMTRDFVKQFAIDNPEVFQMLKMQANGMQKKALEAIWEEVVEEKTIDQLFSYILDTETKNLPNLFHHKKADDDLKEVKEKFIQIIESEKNKGRTEENTFKESRAFLQLNPSLKELLFSNLRHIQDQVQQDSPCPA